MRGKGALSTEKCEDGATLILWADLENPLSPSLLRSAMAFGKASVVVVRREDDPSTPKAIREVKEQIRGAVEDLRRPIAPKVVPGTWLALEAAKEKAKDSKIIGVLDPSARPSVREIEALLRTKGAMVAAPCPVPVQTGSPRLKTLLARLSCSFYPSLFACLGPMALPPIATVFQPEALERTSSGSLAHFRWTLGLAISSSVPKAFVRLLPIPIGCATTGTWRTLPKVIFEHSAILWKASPIRAFLCAVSLLAMPVATLFALLSPSVTTVTLFSMCAALRLSFHLTWTRAVMGLRASLLLFALSPLSDLIAFIAFATSAFKKYIRSERRLFKIKAFGILVPADDADSRT